MPVSPEPILIVDDDAAVRHSLKFALEIEGVEVRLYEGGPELLADPELPSGGCLVVDYQMPAMNGIELVNALRRRHQNYPTVLITGGRINEDLRGRAAAAGVHVVLRKPFSDEALLDSIREALSA